MERGGGERGRGVLCITKILLPTTHDTILITLLAFIIGKSILLCIIFNFQKEILQLKDEIARLLKDNQELTTVSTRRCT